MGVLSSPAEGAASVAAPTLALPAVCSELATEEKSVLLGQGECVGLCVCEISKGCLAFKASMEISLNYFKKDQILIEDIFQK